MKKSLMTCLVFCFFALFLSSCGSGSTAGMEYGKWVFSGYVVDGSTNARIPFAKISYLDIEGKDVELEADSNGAFYISEIPYGQRTFRFSADLNDSIAYTEKLVSVSSMNESTVMEGVVASGTRTIKLFPLNGACKGELYFRAQGSGKLVAAADAVIGLQYKDSTFVNRNPSGFIVRTDSMGRFSFKNLPVDSNLVLTVQDYEYNGAIYEASSIALPRLISNMESNLGRIMLNMDSLSHQRELILNSNVLDADGLGLKGVSVRIVPYFVLSVTPKSQNIAAEFVAGDSTWEAFPSVHGDTVFLNHVADFPVNTSIAVKIDGLDSDGQSISVDLSGNQSFKTGQGIFVLASNAWTSSPMYKSQFSSSDTIWVKFSEELNPDVGLLQWAASSATKSLYGDGSSQNAQAWVSGDTLFVTPDQRFNANTGDKIGFQVNVISKSGLYSQPVEISTEYTQTVFAVRWTNTKDSQGQVRNDLSPRDSILVVPSQAVSRVVGVSSFETNSLPPGATLSQFHMRGDTIVFVPTSVMVPGVSYGLEFDVQTSDGSVYFNAMRVQWKTSQQVSVLSVNNRNAAGYRRFKALGDSLVVRFSEAVDTSKTAAQPFSINIVDVLGKVVQTTVSWNASLTEAVIRNSTPYPLSDYKASLDQSIAVRNVSFDLTTQDGDIATEIGIPGDSIRIVSEEGLCVVNSNVLASHANGYEVLTSEAARTAFPSDTTITVSFNREIDTAYMKLSDLADYVGLETSLGANVAVDVSFSADSKTIYIKPQTALGSTKYWIRLQSIPAQGLRSALAISEHGGLFSGYSTTSKYLLKEGFVVP